MSTADSIGCSLLGASVTASKLHMLNKAHELIPAILYLCTNLKIFTVLLYGSLVGFSVPSSATEYDHLLAFVWNTTH